jgi:hypothetical protein
MVGSRRGKHAAIWSRDESALRRTIKGVTGENTRTCGRAWRRDDSGRTGMRTSERFFRAIGQKSEFQNVRAHDWDHGLERRSVAST